MSLLEPEWLVRHRAKIADAGRAYAEANKDSDLPPPVAFGFDTGTPIWSALTVGSKSRKFETADDLRKACVEYFEWADKHNILDTLIFSNGTKQMNHERAYTKAGLLLHIGISLRSVIYWNDPNHRRYRPDLVEVMEAVDLIIHEQQFTRAAVGVFNGNLVARYLGLADKTETEVTEVKTEQTVVPIQDEPAVYVHPDDPTGGNSGWLFTRGQLEAGMPFFVNKENGS